MVGQSRASGIRIKIQSATLFLCHVNNEKRIAYGETALKAQENNIINDVSWISEISTLS
jgi:hypothetical protein